MRRDQYDEALDILEALEEDYPSSPELLATLAAAYGESGDALGALRITEKMLRITPGDPDALALRAELLLDCGFPFLAEPVLGEFARRFGDACAATARQRLSMLEKALPELLEEAGVKDDAAGRALLQMNDEARLRISLGEFDAAVQLMERALKLSPQFMPALNNLSLAYYVQGNLDKAIECARRGVEAHPSNVHALSNLARYQLLNGQINAAAQTAMGLRPLIPAARGNSQRVKIAEMFSFLGDDAVVLEAFATAEKDKELHDEDGAYLCHLAAVATMHQGDDKRAKALWKRALKLASGFDLAQGNLDDLKRPVSERNAPWAFSLDYWVRPDLLGDLFGELAPLSALQGVGDLDDLDDLDDVNDVDEEEAEETMAAARRALERHPQLAALAPLMLDRGDENSRQFALMVAGTLKSPELAGTVRAFALGQRGSDQLRMMAVQICQQNGWLQERQFRFWTNGQWTNLLNLGFEIHGELTDYGHSEEVTRLIEQAHHAMQADDAAQAIRLYEQVLALEPDAYDAKNNLAAALQSEGRHEEAHRLVEEVHRNHSDYLFARASLARDLAEKGEIERAKDLLMPMMERKRLHHSEHLALGSSFVVVHATAGEADAAAMWLDMLEQTHPDHPMLEALAEQVMLAKLPQNFARFMERAPRKKKK